MTDFSTEVDVPEQLFPSGRWSNADGRRAVDAWRTSGLSRARWCRDNNVAGHRLAYWVYRLKDADDESTVVHHSGFVQLQKSIAASVLSGSCAADGLRVVLPSGVILYLRSQEDAQIGACLLRALI